jgi:hypothetical protein
MYRKLIKFFLSTTIVFCSGGYDGGSLAGKGIWDISLTLNPFNYFKQGQSYIVLGYGLTKSLDINAYYSKNSSELNHNYYLGLSYGIYSSKLIDISTAIGVRKYTKSSLTHFFVPQLLHTLKLTKDFGIGGSFVSIRNKNINNNLGTAIDLFIYYNLFKNNKYKVDLTIGAFKPVHWKPEKNDWYPTYSIDFKIMN